MANEMYSMNDLMTTIIAFAKQADDPLAEIFLITDEAIRIKGTALFNKYRNLAFTVLIKGFRPDDIYLDDKLEAVIKKLEEDRMKGRGGDSSYDFNA